jgi:hypothetical protein
MLKVAVTDRRQKTNIAHDRPIALPPTRRSFTFLKEPARLPPQDNGLNLRSVMAGG